MEQLEVILNLLGYIDQKTEWIRVRIQLTYDWYRETVGIPDPWFDLVSPMIIILCSFWTLGSLYCLLDYYRWPKFLYRFKTHDINITFREIVTTAKVCLYNQFVVYPILVVFFYTLWNLRGMDRGPNVPPLTTILLHLAVISWVQDIAFYYVHRLLHYPPLYRRFHKMHHQYQTVMAITSFYCHPVEHLFCNVMPVMLGALLMGSHRSVEIIWYLLLVPVTLNDHSGYHFPFYFSPQYHDYHHVKPNQNFSRNGFLDYVHQTNNQFWKAIYGKRHQVLLSLTPIQDRIPDPDKKIKDN